MKKLFLGILMIAVLGLTSAAAADTYSKPGSFSAQAGVGLYWGNYGGIDIEGGADFGLFQIPFAPVFPLDVGVSGRVGFATWGALSAGAFGTAHYSWKSLGLGIDVLNRWESYIALGLHIVPGLALDAYGGNAYHLDSNLAVFLESGYHESVLGVSYKF